MQNLNHDKPVLLKEQAYQQLKQMLVDGTYVPGTFLSERRLAEQLGMSKTPVRAALERVEAEGYITVSPQQGIFVRELSLREIKEHYEIRMALETHIVRRLAGSLAPEQVDSLDRNLNAQLVALQENDIMTHVAHDRDFHLLLATCLDNQEILRVMQRQQERAFRVTSQISMHHPSRMQESYEEHLGIFEAVRDGEGNRAAERMLHHLETGRRFILSA